MRSGAPRWRTVMFCRNRESQRQTVAVTALECRTVRLTVGSTRIPAPVLLQHVQCESPTSSRTCLAPQHTPAMTSKRLATCQVLEELVILVLMTTQAGHVTAVLRDQEIKCPAAVPVAQTPAESTPTPEPPWTAPSRLPAQPGTRMRRRTVVIAVPAQDPRANVLCAGGAGSRPTPGRSAVP